MGLNDTHFTNPAWTPGWTTEQHQNEVRFRQQLASVFQPYGPHNVRMETGHTLLPISHPDAIGPGNVRGPQVIISHRNDPDDHFALPIGDDPAQWMGNLAKHLNNRDVMQRMRDQMNGPYGDE
jgi:hypothetical protein